MYDALRYISTYYTFTNGSAAFDTLQLRILHIRVHNICKRTLITFVTLLHIINLNDPLSRNLLCNSLILSRSNAKDR